MTVRHRFLNCLILQPLDRIPAQDLGYWPETIERRHREGLPRWVTNHRHVEDCLQIDGSWSRNWLEVSQGFCRPSERNELSETENEDMVRDEERVTPGTRQRARSIPLYGPAPGAAWAPRRTDMRGRG